MARGAALLLLALTQAPASWAQRPLTLDRYRRLIAFYREGDFQSAAEALAACERHVVERAVEAFTATNPDDPADLRAAALLHSEAGAYLRGQNDLARGDFHWNMARDLSALVGSNPEDRSGRSFQSRWLLAAGYYYQSEMDDSRALGFLKQALRLSDTDAEIHLALGAVHEVVGALMRRAWSPSRVPSTNPRIMRDELRARSVSRQQLSTAEGYYREALRLAPNMAEAHLRLGRVLGQLGDGEKALAELVWVVEHARDAYLLGMAHLFLGSLREQNDDWSTAVEDYRKAVAAKPDWQVHHLALSHALHRAGALGEAERALHAALQVKAREDLPDSGWWTYYLFRERSLDTLDALRDGIRR